LFRDDDFLSSELEYQVAEVGGDLLFCCNTWPSYHVLSFQRWVKIILQHLSMLSIPVAPTHWDLIFVEAH